MPPLKRKEKILVTGGAGFIGSAYCRLLAQQGYRVCIVDRLTYAGDRGRLKEVLPQVEFCRADICQAERMRTIFKKERPDIVVHFAAETHVDRSILDARPFIQTNVVGTQLMVQLSMDSGVKRFLHISTDEVYGDHRQGHFKEFESPLQPNNPYAATKAGAELLVRAAIRTFSFPAIIIRPSNNYGPWQYPEKLIPVVILKALSDERVPVYGKGEQVREWLYVEDCARAIECVMSKGCVGEIYNIGSGFEQPNIKTVKMILACLNKPERLIQYVKDRPGHDFRYSVDIARIKKLGWQPQVPFEEGLELTVDWCLDHQGWLLRKARSLKDHWSKVYKVQKTKERV